MESRYRKLITQQIDSAIAADPGRDSLLRLLQISEITLNDDVLDTDRRDKAFRSLTLLIHPDKEPESVLKALSTKRFQDTKTFYDKCCSRLGEPSAKVRRGATPSRSKSVTLAFHMHDKWPYLARTTPEPIVPTKHGISAQLVSIAMCYKCINYRRAM